MGQRQGNHGGGGGGGGGRGLVGRSGGRSAAAGPRGGRASFRFAQIMQHLFLHWGGPKFNAAH